MNPRVYEQVGGRGERVVAVGSRWAAPDEGVKADHVPQGAALGSGQGYQRAPVGVTVADERPVDPQDHGRDEDEAGRLVDEPDFAHRESGTPRRAGTAQEWIVDVVARQREHEQREDDRPVDDADGPLPDVDGVASRPADRVELTPAGRLRARHQPVDSSAVSRAPPCSAPSTCTARAEHGSNEGTVRSSSSGRSESATGVPTSACSGRPRPLCAIPPLTAP
jgi:hypothetical protein